MELARSDRTLRALVATLLCSPVVLISGVWPAAAHGAPTNTSGGPISGSFNDWVGAVCPSGTASVGQHLRPAASQDGMCLDRPGGPDPVRDRAVSYMISNSVHDLAYLMDQIKVKYFTRAMDNSTGQITLFYMNGGSAVAKYGDSPLRPLEQYGFIIMHAPGS